MKTVYVVASVAVSLTKLGLAEITLVDFGTPSALRSEVPVQSWASTYVTSMDTPYQHEVIGSAREFNTSRVTVSSTAIDWSYDFSWGVPSRNVGYSSARLDLYFTVDEPTYYRVSGQASFQDPYGAFSHLSANIDLEWPLFSAQQQTRGQTGDFSLQLKDGALNSESFLEGSLEGWMEAGFYELVVSAASSDYWVSLEDGNVVSPSIQQNDRGPITSNGTFRMEFSPVEFSIPEPHSGTFLIAILIFAATSRQRRP